MTPKPRIEASTWTERAASFSVGAALRRHWYVLLGCAVVTPLAAGLAHSLTPPTYVSQARVLIKLGREFMGPPSAGGRQSSMYRLNEAINSEIEILRSRRIASRVVDEVGVSRLFSELEEKLEDPSLVPEVAAASVLESLSVSGIAESSVIRVAFAHSDPFVARDALDALVAGFQQEHLRVFSDRGLPVVEAAVVTARAGLTAAEEERSRYREERRVFDPVEEQSLLLRRRDALDLELRTLRTSASRLDAGAEAQAGGVATASDAERQLLALRADERRLLENYYPTSQAVLAVRAQIEALEAVAEARAASEFTALSADEARLLESLEEVDERLRELQVHERSLRELDRSVARQELYLSEALLAKQAFTLDAQLDEQMVTSVAVIDRPSLPLDPIGVGFMAKVVLGLFAGLLLGSGAVFLLHLLQGSRPTSNPMLTSGAAPGRGHATPAKVS